MKSSRWQKVLNHFSGLLLFAFIFVNALSVFAGPGKTTYQAKIVKPDGYPLEATNVNFKFTILDPAGSCILYSETYSSVNMLSTGGLISFALGSGVKTYPASATTFEQVFSNITPSLSCDTGGPANYSPTATDIRKIVMQFHDGSGWQTLPAMNINAVPYAMYANEAAKLNGLTSSNFVQVSTVPTCAASEALRYTGTGFTCIAVGNSVTSSTVVTALGYTPADGASVTTLTSNVSSVSSTVASVSSTVFSVSSTVTSLQSSVAASFAAITSSQWTTSGTNIFYNTGNIGIGTTTPVTKLDVSGGVRIGAESTTCAPALAGTLRYNATNVEYCNGTSWQAFGVSGAGITNFNGSTSGTQSFVTGTGGTAPNIATANGVHTLNIPNASTGSVTAGLISNTDYTTFTNKITSSAASIAQVLGYVPADNAASGTYAQKANNLSDLTNVATARTNLGLGTFATASSIDLGSASATGTLAIARLPSFSGDATIAAASNTIILSNSGVTAGTYTKVTVDSKGRVTSSSALASTDVTTALGYTPASATASTQWTTSGSAIYYNTGNVGIGTAAPGTALDVLGTISSRSSSTWGSGANSTFKAVDPNGLLFSLGLDAGNTKLELNTQYGTMPIVFSVGNSEKMRVNSAGSVGIGTTAPTSKLHVQDGAAVIKGTGSTLTVKKGAGSPNTLSTESVASFDNESGGGVAVNFFGNSAQTASIYMGDTAAPQQGAIKYLVHSAIPTSQYMSFSTSSTERLRIDYFGNVGIGTTAPTAGLHLAAGTSSNASLKFTSGTLLTSPQSGTMEYDGTNFYLTDSTNTRRAIAANTNPGTYDNVSNINSSGNITLIPTGSVVVSSTTASTNSNTGALVVKGGLGVAGNINTAGNLNVSGSSVIDGSLKLSSMTSGSVLFAGTGGTVTQDNSNFYWDGSNKRLGIGTTSPGAPLDVISPNNGTTGGLRIRRPAADAAPAYLQFTNNAGSNEIANIVADTSANLIFSVSAAERVRITPAGAVGIGTSAPGEKLEIAGGLLVNTNDARLRLQRTSGPNYVDYNDTNDFHIRSIHQDDTNANVRMTVTASGNVGVGTTSPGNKLEVSDSATALDTSAILATISGTNVGFKYGIKSNISGATGNSAVAFGGVLNPTNLSNQYLLYGYRSDNGVQTSSIKGDGTAYFAGNVGVGTTTPDHKMRVIGKIKVGTETDNVSANMQSDVNDVFELVSPNTASAPAMSFHHRGLHTVQISGFGSSVTNQGLRIKSGPGEQPAQLHVEGKVGIGTTNPIDKLHVFGVSTVTSGTGNISVIPDYLGSGYIQSYQSVGVFRPLKIDGLGVSFDAKGSNFSFSSGNVGIGTTSPSTALEVSGTVKATAFSGPGILLQSINLAAADFVSHTTSVWLDVPNLSSTFTTAVPTTVDIVASGMYRTMNASVGNVRLVINGTEVAGDYIQQAPSTGTFHANTSINWTQTLAAGTHTIKVQWRNENATGSFDQGWNDSGRVLSRRLKIMVYSQ